MPPPRIRESANGGAGQPQERITVNLTARSAKALEDTAVLAAETKTTVVNKALQFYAYARAMQENGGALYIRESGSDEREKLRLL